MRTPELLIEVVQQAPHLVRDLVGKRSLLRHADSGAKEELEDGLAEEERAERERDRAYWQPLKAELEKLRHAARPR